MKTTVTILSLLNFFLITPGANAQNSDDEQNVKKAIEQLFDGMRSSDSSMVSDVFTRDAIMQTISKNKSGETIVQSGNLEGFLKAIGTPKETVWDEQILSYEINIDGELASAWTPYKFFAGEEFSHCGVNSFQLVNMEGSWKIFFIVDTRRATSCDD